MLRKCNPLCYTVLTNNDLLAIESTEYYFSMIMKNQ